MSTGTILNISDNVLIVNGLNSCFVGEVIMIDSFVSNEFNSEKEDPRAIVMNLEEDVVRIVLYKGSMDDLRVGSSVYRTYKSVKAVVGLCLLGTIVSPLGDLLDTNKSLEEYTWSRLSSFNQISIFRSAPDIISRDPVCIPFITGIMAIDCFLPIGFGQRELVIGDLNTGKTSLAVTMILNQKFIINTVDLVWRSIESAYKLHRKVVRFTPCLYLLVGKRRSEVIRIQNVLIKNNAFHYTCIIYAGCDMKAALLYIAPFAVTAMGEWFMHKGYHAIMVFDDLSEHAVAYRQIALLLRRPPGREAYPGDIFFLHSKLLERCAQLTKNLGGGSLTCIPIIETKMGDISAYIPTNVISITDGQIFLSKAMLNRGIRPAIYLELSVSRVGSKAQYTAMKEVSNVLRRDYRLFKDYEVMSKVSTDLDSRFIKYIERGRLIRKLFSQKLYQSYPYLKEVLSIHFLNKGFFDDINQKYIDIIIGLLFNGNFSHVYLKKLDKPYEWFTFLHYEKQLHIESLLMVSSIKVVDPYFVKIFELFINFFYDHLIPKLDIDTKGSYLKSLFRLSLKVRKAFSTTKYI